MQMHISRFKKGLYCIKKGFKIMDIKLKKNEKTYIISVDYRHHSILSCYANNILTYKMDLSSSLVKTLMFDNCAIITVFKRSQKHNLNEQCCLVIDKDNEYITLPYGGTNGKNLSFIDFVNIIQSYNNIKE